jgi:hypothetical protein
VAELKVVDVAERHGVDRKTAYRWFIELERKFGPRVIGRRGRRGVMFTTEDAFASVAPLCASKAKDDRRFRELEERMTDAETRADRAAAELSAVKRQVSQLAFSFGRA